MEREKKPIPHFDIVLERRPKFSPIQRETSPSAVPAGNIVRQKSDMEKMLEALSSFNGSLDFLADEPDLYTDRDGEPISLGDDEEPDLDLRREK